MSKALDQMSKLFRALGSDDTEFQASTKTAAREAEQRWPLFRAVQTQRPNSTPPLAENARQQWVPEKRVAARPKPGLSVPGLGDKLAKGLTRLAPKQAERSRPQITEDTQEEPPGRPLARSRKQAAAVKSTDSRFPKPMTETTPKTANRSEPGKLFKKNSAKRDASDTKTVGRETGERKLSSVFARLDGDDPQERKPEHAGRGLFGKRLSRR